jgi:hypothetical protein
LAVGACVLIADFGQASDTNVSSGQTLDISVSRKQRKTAILDDAYERFRRNVIG